MIGVVTSSQRRIDLARRQAERSRRMVADELQSARLQSGVSQAVVAAAAGVSRAELSRIERGAAPWLTIEALACLAGVLGLSVSIRLYPDATPLRDAAHLALMERLRVLLAPSLSWRTEVPVPLTGDRRAWDAMVSGPDWSLRIEAETRLHDVQALERRIVLKQRDSGNGNVVLLVTGSRANRRALAVAREALRGAFPLDTREVLTALRGGRSPGGSGIVVL